MEKNDILSFLSLKLDNIFAKWAEKIIVSADHSLRPSIEHSGKLLFQVILQAYSLPEEDRDILLKSYARITAESKAMHKYNIGLFIYNVNAAKKEVLEEISNYSDGPEIYLSEVFGLFEVIDQFQFHVVTFYTAMKDEQLVEEKKIAKGSHEDRLSILGKMTSSFVHEFRNPLTVVNGFIQLLRAENPNLQYLDIIMEELDQLKFRITQFLMLSKNELTDQDASTFTINELIDQVSSFIYPRLLEVNVELESALEDNLYISGHIEEIRQVLINIIFNALDVMSAQHSKSVLHIKGYRTGDKIILETSNSGPEIPNTILENIFEPFVTTKNTGTGLGLYISKQIIEKHQGELLCHSKPNWTTFTIILNAANSPTT